MWTGLGLMGEVVIKSAASAASLEGFQAVIKSAASAASPPAQKIVKNEGKIAFWDPSYRDSYRNCGSVVSRSTGFQARLGSYKGSFSKMVPPTTSTAPALPKDEF